MPFERWGYQFEGAYKSPDSLKSRSGVYVIWCESEGKWTVLEVGEAADVRGRVKNHGCADRWVKDCPGTVYYSATYTPNLQQAERTVIEQKIKDLAKSLYDRH